MLELAQRYESKLRPTSPMPTAKGAGLTDTVGLVEEVLSIPSGGLSALVDRDDDVPVAPALTYRLLSNIVQGREEG